MALVRCGRHDYVFDTEDKTVGQSGKGSAALGHDDCPLCQKEENPPYKQARELAAKAEQEAAQKAAAELAAKAIPVAVPAAPGPKK